MLVQNIFLVLNIVLKEILFLRKSGGFAQRLELGILLSSRVLHNLGIGNFVCHSLLDLQPMDVSTKGPDFDPDSFSLVLNLLLKFSNQGGTLGYVLNTTESQLG